MRLRKVLVGLCHGFDQPEHRNLVGFVRHQPVELEERFAERSALRGAVREHALELSLEVGGPERLERACAAASRKRRDQLLRPLGARIELGPQPRRLERQAARPRGECDFGRATREHRIAGVLRGLDVRARRLSRLAALKRNFAD